MRTKWTIARAVDWNWGNAVNSTSTIFALLILLVSAFPAGAAGRDDGTPPGGRSSGGDPSPNQTAAPSWSVGNHWKYSSSAGPLDFVMTSETTISQNGTVYEVRLLTSTSTIHYSATSTDEGISVTVTSDTQIDTATYYIADTLATLKSETTTDCTVTSTVSGPYVGTTTNQYTTVQVTAYDPPFNTYDFPIQIGETWTASSQVTTTSTSGGTTTTMNSTYCTNFTCAGREEITANEVKYDSFKIVSCSDNYTQYSYYCPEVGNFVYYETLDASNASLMKMELLEYVYSGGTPAPRWSLSDFFVMAADTHIGAPGAEEILKDFVTCVNSMNPKPRFVMIAGDVSDWGADLAGCPPGSDNLKKARDELDKLNVDWYSVPGNHDARGWGPRILGAIGSLPGDGDAFKAYESTMPTPSYQKEYALEYDKLEILALNSGADALSSFKGDPMLPESKGISDAQEQWVEETLAKLPSDRQKILILHHPLTEDQDGSVTNHYSDLVETCLEHGVTVIGGHSHARVHALMESPDKAYRFDSWQVPSLADQRAFELVSLVNGKVVLTHRVLAKSTRIGSHSPVHVGILNTDGGSSGIDQNGTLKQDLPGTVYIRLNYASGDPNDSVETVSVDGLQKSFYVWGLKEGAYAVEVEVNDGEGQILRINASTRKGQVDTFEVTDWNAVAQGRPDSVKVTRDVNGDGRPETTFTAGQSISENDFKATKGITKSTDKPSWYLIGMVVIVVAVIAVGLVINRRRRKGSLGT